MSDELNPRYTTKGSGDVHDVAKGVATKMLMASRARPSEGETLKAKEPKKDE